MNPESIEEGAKEARREKVCEEYYIIPRELRLREIATRNKKGGNGYQ